MLFDLSNEYDRVRFDEYTAKLKGERCKVEVTRKKYARTMRQNRYLHLLLGYFASEFGYSLDEVKYEFFKKKCNREIFEREGVNKRGRQVRYMRSSADLNTREMTEAIESFRNWSAAECGLYLPSPSEADALFYAEKEVEKNKEYL